MEEANNSYSNQVDVGSDGDSVPTKWGDLLREIKDSTVSMVRNMKLPQHEQLAESVLDYEKKLSWLKEHITGVASKMKTNIFSSDESMRALEAELDTEKGLVRVLLQEKVSRLETDLADRDREIGDLKREFGDARESFLKEKTEIFAECESKVEDVTRECDAKMEFYEGKQKECFELIEQLKADLSQRCGELDKLNLDLGAKKSECETLMTEKKELVAQLKEVRNSSSTWSNILRARLNRFEMKNKELTEKLNRLGLNL